MENDQWQGRPEPFDQGMGFGQGLIGSDRVTFLLQHVTWQFLRRDAKAVHQVHGNDITWHLGAGHNLIAVDVVTHRYQHLATQWQSALLDQSRERGNPESGSVGVCHGPYRVATG